MTLPTVTERTTVPVPLRAALSALTTLAALAGPVHAGTPDGAFASTPVPADGKPADGARFADGEPIFGRIFLAGPLGEQIDAIGSMEFVMGGYSRCSAQFRALDLNAEQRALTSIPIYLSVEPDALPDLARDRNLRSACLDWPSTLDLGTQQVTVTFTGARLRYTAKLELVVTAESRAAWAARHDRVEAAKRAKDEEEAAAARGLPKAGMRDKKLAAQILAGWKASKRAGKPGKVVIESRDWSIKRDDSTGAIRAREVLAWVTLKLPGGTCALDRMWVSQRWSGAGYGRTLVDLDHAPFAIDCSKLK